MAASLWMLPFYVQAEYEQDILFFDAFLQNYNLNKNVDILTSDYENYYINTFQLNEALGLSLTINYPEKKLNGWYLKQVNQVNLRFSDIGKINQQWMIYEDELYIRSDRLSDLLGITTKINTINLIASFYTRDQHPLLAKLERHKKYRNLSILNTLKTNYPIIADKYSMITQPTVELRVNQRKGLTSQTSDSQALNINSRFDMLYHASAFSFNRTNTSRARFNMQRAIDWQSTQYRYEFGDVRPIALSGVNTGSFGRGFRFAIDGADQDNNRRRFEGNATPGWDAELYQEGRLIAFQTIDENGRYLFENITLRFGYNAFSVRLYGPTGEFRTIPYEFFSLDRGVTSGVLSPEISYVESGKDFLFSGQNDASVSTVARLNYGINDGLATRITAVSIDKVQGESRGFGAGITQIFHDNKIDFDWLKFDRGINQKAAFLSRLFSGDLTLDWSRRTAFNTPTKQLQMNYLYDFGILQAGVFINQNKTPLTENKNYAIQLSHANRHIQYTQVLSRVQLPNLSPMVTSDNNINFRIGKWFIQSEFGLTLNDSSFLHNFRLSGRYRWRGFSIATRYSEDKRSMVKDFNLQLTRNYTVGRFGLSFSHDFNNNTAIGITFGTHFDFNGKTGTTLQSARIKTHVFEDKNYNKIYDKNDIPIENAKFLGRYHWHHYATNTHGEVTLPGAVSYQPQTVRLDKSSLDNPFLTLVNEGFHVENHSAGENYISFPLWKTFEIEGVLVSKENSDNSDNQEKLIGLAGVVLWLKNSAGEKVYRTRTEYDGFFIFENILPGRYQLVIDRVYLKRKSLMLKKPLFVVINHDSDELVALDDIVLMTTEEMQTYAVKNTNMNTN